MKLLSFWVVLLSVYIGGCADRGMLNLQSGNLLANKNWTSEKASFEVPFEWHDGHIIIVVNINNGSGVRLAFDSGAAATVLFETERTEPLYLSGSGQISLNGHQIDIVNDIELKMKHIQFSGLTVLYVPIGQSPLFDDIEQAYFDGAIGYDLLSEYVIKVDYSAKKLRFYKEGLNVTEDEGWQVLPLDVVGRIPYVEVSLGDTNESTSKYKFVLDTGAPDYLYLNSDLTENFDFANQYYDTHMSNFEGNFVAKTGKIHSVYLAGTRFSDLVSHDLPNFQDPIGVGLIGSGLLRQFDLILDYENSLVALKPNNAFSTDSFADRSGLQIEPHKRGGIVKQVNPDSHAFKSGIRTGDLLTSINDVKISASNFDQQRSLLSSELDVLAICFGNKAKQTCTNVNLNDRL